MKFIERLDEVGYLSCLVRIFVYIEYLRLELIYAFFYVYCGLRNRGNNIIDVEPNATVLPPKSIQENQKNHSKGNASFTHKCG
jgi:hypothetical protein